MIPKLRPALLLPDIGGLFALTTFIVLCLFSDGRALNDGDTFWHIAAGQRMLASKSILTEDIFSHTAFGKPWTAHEWLAEIIMAWVHGVSGLPGICIFFFFIATFSFLLLYVTVRQETSEWFSLIFVALAFVFSYSHLLARPHIFTWLLGGLTFLILRKQNKALYFLPLISLLWANLHAGFILGILLQAMFLVGSFMATDFPLKMESVNNYIKDKKRPIFILLLSIVAVAINPFGFSLYFFPFHVSADVFAQGINEWLSPNLQKQWLFRFYLLFILFLLTQSTVKTTWLDRLFLIFFINSALVHQRHISIATYFLAPFLAKSTENWLMPILRKIKPRSTSDLNTLVLSRWSGPVTTFVLVALFLFLSSPAFPNTQSFFQTIIPLPEKRWPVSAVDYLSENRPKGNMFNEYSWGGYTIFALRPEQPVFIDGRADMYGAEIFSDYQKFVKVDKNINELLDKYQIKWVFFPSDSNLIRYLKLDDNWHEIYSDELASILIRDFQ